MARIVLYRPLVMTRSWTIALLGALSIAFLGCADYALEAGDTRDPLADDDDWSDDDAGDDDLSDDDGCVIVGTVPLDGDPTVYYRDPLRVFFETPVSAASVSLADHQGGVPGTVSLSEDGRTAIFDPYGDEPEQHLQPLTDYAAHVDAPGCTADWTFATSDLGLELAHGVVFEHARYLVHLDEAKLAQPAGFAALLAPLQLRPFLMTAHQAEPGALSLAAGGMAFDAYDEPVQDPCVVTVDLTPVAPAALTGSHLSLAETDVTLTIASGTYLDLLDLSVEAEFTQTGEGLEEGRIEGWVDGFVLDAAIEALDGEPGAATCQTLDQLGHPCEACPGNPAQLTCIHFVWEDVRGELLGMHAALDDVDEQDLDACGK